MHIYAPRSVNDGTGADFVWDPREALPGRSDGGMRVGWCSARQHFRRESSTATDTEPDIGVFLLDNPTVFFMKSGWPLFLDRERSEYLFSDRLGMRAAFIKNTREVSALPRKKIGLSVDTQGKPLALDNVIVLESPGFKVWGHWIVDQYPRLYLLERLEMLAGANFVFFNPLPRWTSDFLDTLGIGPHQLHVLNARSFAPKSVIVPSFYRERDALFAAYLTQAWGHLKTSLLEQQPSEKPRSSWLNALRSFAGRNREAETTPSLIYLSRGKWGSSITNEKALEGALAKLGFAVVYPEDHSLAQQARMMDHADVVVGEDGSAMHNLVFCRQTSASITICSRFTNDGPPNFRHSRYQKLISSTASPLGTFYEPAVHGDRVEVDLAHFTSVVSKLLEEQRALKARSAG